MDETESKKPHAWGKVLKRSKKPEAVGAVGVGDTHAHNTDVRNK